MKKKKKRHLGRQKKKSPKKLDTSKSGKKGKIKISSYQIPKRGGEVKEKGKSHQQIGAKQAGETKKGRKGK